MSRGHWRQRGDKIELRVYVGRDPITRKKRVVTETIPACGTRAADDALAAFVAKHRRPAVSSSATFGELAERYFELRSPRWAPAGVKEARRIIDSYLEPLADVPIEKLDRPALEAFYAALARRGGRCRLRKQCESARCEHGAGGPLSAATVQRAHHVVHAALELAVGYGWLSSNPATGADYGEVVEEEREAPEPDDVLKLLELAAIEDAELVTFLALDAVTGARLGELVALRYSRIKGGVLSISHTISLGPSGPEEVAKRFRNKGRARTVALGPAITALLTSHRARMAERALKFGVALPPNAFVFSYEPDGSRPWRPDSASRRFKRLVEKAGLVDVHFHDLRHYVSTMLLDEGIALPTVAGRLGHSSSGTTTLGRYAHRRRPRDQAAAELLERLLGLTPTPAPAATPGQPQ